jgi:hypothetical protein
VRAFSIRDVSLNNRRRSMVVGTAYRGSVAALGGIVALSLSGTAVGTPKGVAVTSAATKSVSSCAGLVDAFQTDVVSADFAQAAGNGADEAAWRSAAFRAASDWLQSGCFSSAS